MPNTLTNIMPKILARGLAVLRERCVMPRLVNSDYSTDAAKKGDVINVPLPTALTVSDVVATHTPGANTPLTPLSVAINLDKWKQSQPFFLTDKEMVEIDRNEHFLPMEVDEAVRALANQVNSDILEQSLEINNFVGTAGTVPFGVSVTDATNSRKQLNKQNCPLDNRRGVVNFDAEANMLALAAFADAEKIGGNEVKIAGEIGVKYGIQWVADDAVKTHTVGTLTGTIDVSGNHAQGATSVLLSAGAGEAINLNRGDVINFANHSTNYAVLADLDVAASSTGSVQIRPGLTPSGASAVPNATVVTRSITANHVIHPVFHRDAFAYATRPLIASTIDMQLGSRIMSMQDPQTGIVLRLEVKRQQKQVVWEFDMLYGTRLVRQELAVRLLG